MKRRQFAAAAVAAAVFRARHSIVKCDTNQVIFD
jgi:hypothetical protein